MSIIFLKELQQIFRTILGYIFLFVFILICGLYFSAGNLLSYSGDVSIFFQNIVMPLMFIIPMLTMRSFAEEKRYRTDQLLFTSPVPVSGIVLGKFFAVFTVFLIGIAATLPYSFILTFFGSPLHWVPVLNYCALILIAAAFISIGIFMSSITDSQVIAAISTYALIFFFWYAGSLSSMLKINALSSALNWLSFMNRYYNLTIGIFNPASIVFLFSVTFLFIYFTIHLLESKKYNAMARRSAQ